MDYYQRTRPRPYVFSRDLRLVWQRFHNSALFSILICLAISFLLLTMIGCDRDERPHLILVIMDTTRADRLGCYGHTTAATSTLDSLATVGVRFANAFTAAPVTGPAIATILSGVHPATHGLQDNARFTLNPALELMAEVFTANGYITGAVVGAMPLQASFGFDQGFMYFDDRFAEDPYQVYKQAFAEKEVALQESERRADAVTDRALRWLADVKKGKPLFLLAHYYDPHGPYDPPPSYAARFADAYDGEIAFMDAEIGRLLAGVREQLGNANEIRVVAVGDHGEGLGDHNEQTHGFFIYDTTIKVPLVFAGSDMDHGRVVKAGVRTVDIMPTICAWCSVPAPHDASGQSLSAALRGGPVPAACDTAYLETFLTQLQHNWSPLQGIRTSSWKWIRAPRPELYDLHHDPAEANNVIVDQPQVAEALAANMDVWLAHAAVRNQRLGANRSAIAADVARQLEALGYVGKQASKSLKADFSLTDPKDGNREWNLQMERKRLISTARHLRRQGDLEQALQMLTQAADLAPLTGKEAALAGTLNSELGQPVAAVAAFRAALQTVADPAGRGVMRLRLARALLAAGDLDAATAHVDTLRLIKQAPPAFHASVEELAAAIKTARGER